MTEPARREQTPPLDVRVGSSTNARAADPRSASVTSARACSSGSALAAIAVAAVIADQVTKQVVARTLALGEEVQIAGPFSIHHVHNSGIAFGLFSNATSLVVALTALAVLWMLVFFARSGARHPVLPVALGLVLGGSLANLLDRVRLGHVTDFLDFRYWPAFNLADVFIVVGVASLLRGACRRRPPLEAPSGPDLATLRFRAPEAERLDRALAGRPEVGSRGACRAADRRRGRPRRRRAPRRRAIGSTGGEDVVVELPADAAPLEPEDDGRSASPGRTSTCSSSTSPRASSSIPVPATRRGTLVHGLLALDAPAVTTERPGIVHRLDRDTSGLLVVARSREAHERLQESIRRREVERALPRAREGVARVALGADRGADRP